MKPTREQVLRLHLEVTRMFLSFKPQIVEAVRKGEEEFLINGVMFEAEYGFCELVCNAIGDDDLLCLPVGDTFWRVLTIYNSVLLGLPLGTPRLVYPVRVAGHNPRTLFNDSEPLQMWVVGTYAEKRWEYIEGFKGWLEEEIEKCAPTQKR